MGMQMLIFFVPVQIAEKDLLPIRWKLMKIYMIYQSIYACKIKYKKSIASYNWTFE